MFPFCNILFRFRDIPVFVLCKLDATDDVIGGSSMKSKHKINNIRFVKINKET